MRRMEGAIGGLRGGWWWCVRVRKRQAACESGMRKRGHAKRHAKQAGMQMRREHDGKRWKRARTLKAALSREIEIPAVPRVLSKFFSFRRKNLNIFSFGFVVSEFATLHFDFRTKIRIPRGM